MEGWTRVNLGTARETFCNGQLNHDQAVFAGSYCIVSGESESAHQALISDDDIVFRLETVETLLLVFSRFQCQEDKAESDLTRAYLSHIDYIDWL